MPSSFHVKELDPAHEPAIEALQKRFRTSTVSKAIAGALSVYVKDQEALALATKQRDYLLRLIIDRNECERDAEQWSSNARKLDRDLVALAKSIAKRPRQIRIDLP